MCCIVVDMTFTHEGNKTCLDGLVNFEKMHMLAQTMRTIRYCRSRHLGKLYFDFNDCTACNAFFTFISIAVLDNTFCSVINRTQIEV